jgi:hypothetical protein
MLPNGIAGVEFHHEHRVLYKSLPEHHDHLYKCIFSDGRLNRIARTEFFRRQSVMSFADRRATNDQHKVTLSFSLSVHLCFTMANIYFFVIAPFFLKRSNGMATDIGFLAPRLDRHVLEWG